MRADITGLMLRLLRLIYIRKIQSETVWDTSGQEHTNSARFRHIQHLKKINSKILRLYVPTQTREYSKCVTTLLKSLQICRSLPFGNLWTLAEISSQSRSPEDPRYQLLQAQSPDCLRTILSPKVQPYIVYQVFRSPQQ